MTDNTDIFIIIGTTIGTILCLIFILITIIYCYKRFYHQSKEEDESFHSVMVNKHFRSISFISNDYHNNMTLMVPSRRLAILELQQQDEEEQFTYENPLLEIDTKTVRF